jgi:hypothetical protein
VVRSTFAAFADRLGAQDQDRIAVRPDRGAALVPEAVAFAFVAGVHPLVGLYAAFIVGLITAFSAAGRA